LFLYADMGYSCAHQEAKHSQKDNDHETFHPTVAVDWIHRMRTMLWRNSGGDDASVGDKVDCPQKSQRNPQDRDVHP
jgi:hypothetical protein